MEIKIGIFLMLAGATSAFADPAYAQVTKISLDANSARLESVMDEIENKSEFYFIFNQKQIDVNRVVDIKVKDKLVDEILAELFSGTNVNYEVFDRKILLTTEPIEKSLGDNPQQQAITGTVTDVHTGESMPGVNVIVKGTVTGILTDVDGKYSLFVPDPQATLIFSFIGYSPQEIAVAGQKVIDVKMALSVSTFDEVVVIGYGTQKRVSLTGSVATVGNEKLTRIGVGDATSRLQGQVTGVTVTNNWMPGSTATIRVRGYGSIRNSNPLYIIDGVPRFTFDNINPNDIESISVLKDASSAAIYGSRAANGVILVTTKRGKEGKTKVSFSAKHGLQYFTESSKPDLMNSQEYVDNLEMKWTNMGLAPGMPGWGDNQVGYGDPRLPDYIFPAGKMEGEVDESTYTHPSVSPYNAITRSQKGDNIYDSVWSDGAPIDDYNLTMSGGSSGSTYSLSLGYNHQKGIFNYDGDNYNGATNGGYTRYSLRSNSDIRINKWLKISPDISAFYAQKKGSTDNGSIAINWNPMLPIYDINGNFAGTKIPLTGNGVNPVAELVRNNRDYTNELNLMGSVAAQITFTKDLTFRSVIGSSLRSSYFANYTLANPEFNQTNNTASFGATNTNNFQYNWTNTLSYLKTLGGSHNINLLLGTETLDQNSSDLSGSRSTYAFEIQDYMILNSGQKDINNSGTVDQSRIFSYFGRVNYDYKGKYILEGVIRRDGSSRFVGDNRWGTFPAFSAGWRISEEYFIENLTWIDNLKLRVGWGQNGNDNVGNYNAYSTYGGLDSRSYYNITGASRSSVSAGFSKASIGNTDAKWETGVSTNLGLDITLFKGKLDGVLDIYDRRTKDMLYTDTRPGVWGMATLPDKNIGEMRNTGYEVTLTFNGGKIESDLSYNVSVNISHFKNEVVKLNNNPNEIFYGNNTEAGYSTATVAGQPFNAFYGYVFEGYFNTQDEINEWPKYNPNASGVDTYTRLGVMKFKDVNGDGVITNLDRTFIGDGYPDLTYGLNANINYKNWDMSIGIQGLYGRDVINNAQRTILFIRNDGNYLTKRLYESWTPERFAAGEKITVPITINTDANMQLPSSYFISKGDYLRLRDITIGYSLSAKVLSKLNLDNLRVFVQANNLFTITNYNGSNPEVPDSGVDGNVYPTPRIFTFGITMDL